MTLRYTDIQTTTNCHTNQNHSCPEHSLHHNHTRAKGHVPKISLASIHLNRTTRYAVVRKDKEDLHDPAIDPLRSHWHDLMWRDDQQIAQKEHAVAALASEIDKLYLSRPERS
ncbi:hypothetical protein Ahy_B03g064112 isoform B [Arachis hypogaea]|uniref:Uncharacterized protein n=1 Tax=Arachis hypogaea TaxID=3818 RepID=A0A444ZZ39_ARAHY|nr:hypothetical protein Ahy_B03g064112 isoform B [Arachis hypogaea]